MNKTEIAARLPEIFQRTVREGSPLDGLLEIMETLHAPSEKVLAGLDSLFNPFVTTDAMAIYIARWVDIAGILDESDGDAAGSYPPEPISSGIGRLRVLAAAASNLSREMGTREGLVRFLETATGIKGFRIEERMQDAGGHVLPYHVGVEAPQEAEPHHRLIRKIIEMEKPAHVTYELSFSGTDHDDGE